MKERIHSLDKLRAVMMLLGVIFHASLIYSFMPTEAWKLHDPNSRSYFFSGLILLLHTFRMPVFFILAGFFAALIFYKKGARKMLENRFKRIFLPFIVALVTLLPIYKYSLKYGQLAFTPDINLHTFPSLSWDIFNPLIINYLWFLNYLSIFIAVIVIFVLSKSYHSVNLTRLKSIFRLLIQKQPISILWISLLPIITLYFMNSPFAKTDFYLFPHFASLLFYFVFFLFGWLLYSTEISLKLFHEKIWFNLALATALLVADGMLMLYQADNYFYLKIMLYSVASWLYCFGFIGLFLKYFNRKSNVMQYLSDASYWVYLTHLPVIVVIGSTFVDLPLTVTEKFLSLIFMTYALTILSYHYFVRYTFVGEFLNGKKHFSTT